MAESQNWQEIKVHPRLAKMLGTARYLVLNLAQEKKQSIPPEQLDLVLVGVMRRRFEKCLGELWEEVIAELPEN